ERATTPCPSAEHVRFILHCPFDVLPPADPHPRTSPPRGARRQRKCSRRKATARGQASSRAARFAFGLPPRSKGPPNPARRKASTACAARPDSFVGAQGMKLCPASGNRRCTT